MAKPDSHPDIIMSAERARTFARKLKAELLARHGLDIRLSQAQELTAAAAGVQGGWHAIARLDEPRIPVPAEKGVLARQKIQSIERLVMDKSADEVFDMIAGHAVLGPRKAIVHLPASLGGNPAGNVEEPAGSPAFSAWEPVWADLGDSGHLVDLRVDIRNWLGRVDAGDLADLVADGWNTPDIAERIYLCLADLEAGERTPATDVSTLEDVVIANNCAGHETFLRLKIDERQATAWIERWRPDAWRALQDSDPSP